LTRPGINQAGIGLIGNQVKRFDWLAALPIPKSPPEQKHWAQARQLVEHELKNAFPGLRVAMALH
jgi:hypothetical protein